MMSIAYDYHTTAKSEVLHEMLLIDGQHVAAATERAFNSLNPATEEVIAVLEEGWRGRC